MVRNSVIRTVTAIIFAVIYLFCSWQVSSAVDNNFDERRAKLRTAYLFNIAKFASFPGASTINICISDHSSLHAYVLDLDKRALDNGRQLGIISNPNVSDSCHIAYIDRHTETTWPSRQVLTIGEAETSAADATVIQFFEDANKIRFSINLEYLDNAVYSLSSKLVRLARTRK